MTENNISVRDKIDGTSWNKSNLPEMPGEDIADQVVSGIPELATVVHGDIYGEYGAKDGVLHYHFYHRERKQIYDKAHQEMDKVADTATNYYEKQRRQEEIARKANEELEKVPWWPNFGEILKEVFSTHFMYRDHKINYFREVDSWSVVLPEKGGPLSHKSSYLQIPFRKVALRVI